jgi:nicotinate-nucleotide adenylyltransferase
VTRVALFGGTFDPPHRGHITIARAAADIFSLDRVLFAPTGKQPLKTTATGASYADRLAMVQLAIAGEDPFEISTLDAPRPDGSANYTVDTLSRLGSQLAIESAAETKIFCITGADAFLDIRRWRQPELLLELAEWIVVSRPGFSLGDLKPLALTLLQSSRVHLLEGIAVDVSATHLREALHSGLNVDDSLPPGVGDYIRSHHLYTSH